MTQVYDSQYRLGHSTVRCTYAGERVVLMAKKSRRIQQRPYGRGEELTRAPLRKERSQQRRHSQMSQRPSPVLRPELEQLKGMARELRLAGTACSWSRFRDAGDPAHHAGRDQTPLGCGEASPRTAAAPIPCRVRYSAVLAGRRRSRRSRAIDTRVREGLAITWLRLRRASHVGRRGSNPRPGSSPTRPTPGGLRRSRKRFNRRPDGGAQRPSPRPYSEGLSPS